MSEFQIVFKGTDSKGPMFNVCRFGDVVHAGLRISNLPALEGARCARVKELESELTKMHERLDVALTMLRDKTARVKELERALITVRGGADPRSEIVGIMDKALGGNDADTGD